MEIIKGDLLEIKRGIICHQVNCMGKMGAGLALQIKNKFPTVYDAYMTNFKWGGLALGKLFLVQVANGLYVANLCGQYGYGRNRRYTDYNAVSECLKKLGQWRDLHHSFTGEYLKIFIPYNMGCALGGGDWTIVSKLIEESGLNTIIVKRG